MQPVAPAAARHDAARVLIHDHHFAVADDVFDIAAEQGVGLQGVVDMVQGVNFRRVEEIFHSQKLLDLLHAPLGHHDLPGFFIHPVVAQFPLFFFRRRRRLEPGNDGVHLVVLLGGVLRLAGNDQGRARLVNENGVHFVHDGEVEFALDVILQPEFHVVAEEIETQLRIVAVGDVGTIRLLPLAIRQAVDNHAHAHAEEFIEASHPFGVAAGQVIIDGDDMYALAFQGVEVTGQGGDQGLAFAGAHFRDAARVKHRAADQLDIKMPHVEDAASGLAADGEGLGQEIIELFALLDALAEFGGLGLKLGVGQRLDAGFQGVDPLDHGADFLEHPLIGSSEQGCDHSLNHLGKTLYRGPRRGSESRLESGFKADTLTMEPQWRKAPRRKTPHGSPGWAGRASPRLPAGVRPVRPPGSRMGGGRGSANSGLACGVGAGARAWRIGFWACTRKEAARDGAGTRRVRPTTVHQEGREEIRNRYSFPASPDQNRR
ncbi:MAG: hypothetical protein GMKNLPBB_01729 [Myxococcota bacterium]|nr:hypothetical protein [Myxococcota bacterium]